MTNTTQPPKAIPFNKYPIFGYNFEQFQENDPEIYQYHDPRTPEEYLKQYLEFIDYENLTDEERAAEATSLLRYKLGRILELINLNAPECVLYGSLNQGVLLDFFFSNKIVG